MKFVLHRSISFWSGILVMALIVGGWWDSMLTGSRCIYTPFSVGQHHGGCFVNLSKGRRPASVPAGAFGAYRDGITYDGRHLVQLIPPPAFFRGGGHSGLLGPPESDPFTAELRDPTKKRSHLEQYKLLMVLRPVGDWYLFVPHWLILTVVAAVWTGLLAWRARRRRRAAASLA